MEYVKKNNEGKATNNEYDTTRGRYQVAVLAAMLAREMVKCVTVRGSRWKYWHKIEQEREPT